MSATATLDNITLVLIGAHVDDTRPVRMDIRTTDGRHASSAPIDAPAFTFHQDRNRVGSVWCGF